MDALSCGVARQCAAPQRDAPHCHASGVNQWRNYNGTDGSTLLPRTAGEGRKTTLPKIFLADVNSRSRSLYAIADPSVCRLSVCDVGAPYSAG